MSPPSGPEPAVEGFEEQLVQARTARGTPAAPEPEREREVDAQPVEDPINPPTEAVAEESAPDEEPAWATSEVDWDVAPAPVPESEPAPVLPNEDDAGVDAPATALAAAPAPGLLATPELSGAPRTPDGAPSDGQRVAAQATPPLPTTAARATTSDSTGPEPVVLEPLALAEASAGGAGGQGLGGDSPQFSETGAQKPNVEAADVIGAAAPREPAFTEELARTVSARETRPAPSSADTERAADILRQVRVAITPDLRRATIALSPPSLGRIHIRMSVQGGTLTAVIRAEEPAAVQALAHQLPELRATLAQQGIAVEHVDLGLGSEARRDGNREHPAHDGSQPAHRNTRPAASAAPRELHKALAHASARSGIDTYA